MAAAAQAAGAAGSVGATALGLGMGKTDLDLTRDLFKLQMRQAKRLWTADWAEASVRHAEQCMQAAQQHSEAQALATAAYFQAEKIASQGIKLARDQDSRAYEMTWRAEVRESLRDELANQNNRFNIIMLCDTVCLSCVFSLVADGTPPEETSSLMLNMYLFSLGLSVSLFSISLWCAVIVVRRLHEHTASILERKLFAQSEDLQKIWQHQLKHNQPTGPQEMLLLNQAYEKWVAEFLLPLGRRSIDMLTAGVCFMFVTGGLLTNTRYSAEFDNAPTAVPMFWSFVTITIVTVLYMKCSEDRKERMKQGVYNNSWQDRAGMKDTINTGPFAKVSRAAEELSSSVAMGLGSAERVKSMETHERMERTFCVKTQSLHNRVESLRRGSDLRSKTRKDILQLLTTAAEELDALPEELSSRLNKVLHDIDEADSRTADLVTMRSENMLDIEGSSRGAWSRLRRLPPRARQAIAPYPIDAQRIPVSLESLRKKLGETSHTVMLRITNASEEPLRLKSGVQLKEGKFFKSLNATDPHNIKTCYHLYPGTEIPPRTEVIIAARNIGGWALPTSGIEGEIMYTNRDESWTFRISFSNQRLRNVRKCQVQTTQVGGGSDDMTEDEQYWKIEKDELDLKANNEVAVTIDRLQGGAAVRASFDYRQSLLTLKTGFLLKNRAFGLGLQWQQKWFVLTPKEIVFSEDIGSAKKSKIAVRDITSVRQGSDIMKKNVFEIHTSIGDSGPYKLSAPSLVERDDWIHKILDASAAVDMATEMERTLLSEHSISTSASEDGFECIESGLGTQVMPV